MQTGIFDTYCAEKCCPSLPHHVKCVKIKKQNILNEHLKPVPKIDGWRAAAVHHGKCGQFMITLAPIFVSL